MYLFENYFSDKMYGFKYGGYLYGLKEETKLTFGIISMILIFFTIGGR